MSNVSLMVSLLRSQRTKLQQSTHSLCVFCCKHCMNISVCVGSIRTPKRWIFVRRIRLMNWNWKVYISWVFNLLVAWPLHRDYFIWTFTVQCKELKINNGRSKRTKNKCIYSSQSECWEQITNIYWNKSVKSSLSRSIMMMLSSKISFHSPYQS